MSEDWILTVLKLCILYASMEVWKQRHSVTQWQSPPNNNISVYIFSQPPLMQAHMHAHTTRTHHMHIHTHTRTQHTQRESERERERERERVNLTAFMSIRQVSSIVWHCIASGRTLTSWEHINLFLVRFQHPIIIIMQSSSSEPFWSTFQSLNMIGPLNYIKPQKLLETF